MSFAQGKGDKSRRFTAVPASINLNPNHRRDRFFGFRLGSRSFFSRAGRVCLGEVPVAVAGPGDLIGDASGAGAMPLGRSKHTPGTQMPGPGDWQRPEQNVVSYGMQTAPGPICAQFWSFEQVMQTSGIEVQTVLFANVVMQAQPSAHR